MPFRFRDRRQAFGPIRFQGDVLKEANPLAAGIVGRPAALWAAKTGVTAGTIVVAERLWRQHHRAQAIGMMIASNGVMAVVAAHNASVIRRMR